MEVVKKERIFLDLQAILRLRLTRFEFEEDDAIGREKNDVEALLLSWDVELEQDGPGIDPRMNL